MCMCNQLNKTDLIYQHIELDRSDVSLVFWGVHQIMRRILQSRATFHDLIYICIKQSLSKAYYCINLGFKSDDVLTVRHLTNCSCNSLRTDTWILSSFKFIPSNPWNSQYFPPPHFNDISCWMKSQNLWGLSLAWMYPCISFIEFSPSFSKWYSSVQRIFNVFWRLRLSFIHKLKWQKK